MPQQNSSIVVLAEQDRKNNPASIGTDRNLTKISGDETDQRLALFEWIGRSRGGPPLHVHPEQDEIFFVLEGVFDFQCGKDRSRLGPNDTIFLPRGIPHTFCQLSDTSRLLFMFTPAGRMEAFFFAASEMRGQPSPDEAERLFAAHGMSIVGPPIEPYYIA